LKYTLKTFNRHLPELEKIPNCNVERHHYMLDMAIFAIIKRHFCLNLKRVIPIPVVVLMLLSFGHWKCTGVSSATVDSIYMDYDTQKVPYRFYAPQAVHALHYDLEEISGLAWYREGELLAIQDESGKVFVLSTRGDILRTVKFAKSGDYECIEMIGDQVYVMQSDGDLYSFNLSDTDKAESKKTETAFTINNDIEGMGLLDGKLLIVTKASGDIKGNKIKGKGGYLLDPETKKLDEKETFAIQKNAIDDFIQGKRYFNKLRDFDPSAVAVHPITEDIYVLSADRCIVVMNADFEIIEVIKLDRKTYKQPEGLCFSPNGTMYISSEGDGARGRLMEISYQMK